MSDEEKEELTEKRKRILQEAEKVIKMPDFIEATDTEESDTEKALKILLGEEK